MGRGAEVMEVGGLVGFLLVQVEGGRGGRVV